MQGHLSCKNIDLALRFSEVSANKIAKVPSIIYYFTSAETSTLLLVIRPSGGTRINIGFEQSWLLAATGRARTTV